ncbi:MAG: hypothetical protein ACXAC7_01660 [Candidatus Hodarchaeales archaeon]|jgi:hypothetical protein
MSKATTIPQIITDQVPKKYIDSPEQLATMYRSFESHVERYKERRERIDSISECFLLGTLEMISGDLKFEQGQHQEAIPDLTNATEFFQKGLKIISKKEFDFPDNSWNNEFERRALYSQARITHAEALISLKKGFSEQERIMIKNVLELAAQAYQEEIQLNQKNDDFFHMLLALRNLYKVHIRVAEQDSELKDSIIDKRKALYTAMTHARKAIFLGERKIPQSYFDRTIKKIKKLTVQKFLDRADDFWQGGLNAAAIKDYENASSLFWAGVKIYDEIKRLERKQEFELQGQMFRVTALENDAKKDLALDKNLLASEKFQQASQLMDNLITTVKELGNLDLVHLFQIQSNYFDGMNLFCSGLIAYDNDETNVALRSLKGAQRSLRSVLKQGRELDNKPLIQSCKDGLKQIETYVETLELLIDDS